MQQLTRIHQLMVFLALSTPLILMASTAAGLETAFVGRPQPLQAATATTTSRPSSLLPLIRSGSTSTRCFLAKSNPGAAALPPNEFSRTLRPDRIQRNGIQRTAAGYQTSIQADPEECRALAKRFDLSDIASLAADLTLRPGDSSGSRYSASSTASFLVEGTCRATVTQRCVRTNEDFPIDLEFPLYCVLRPVVAQSGMLGTDELLNTGGGRGDEDRRTERRGGGGGGGGKTTSYRPDAGNSFLNDMDLLELQRMLQADLNDEDDLLMEDEAIYTTGGLMDVGELVAQLFCLELDPYPKKPGTGPIQRSITG